MKNLKNFISLPDFKKLLLSSPVLPEAFKALTYANSLKKLLLFVLFLAMAGCKEENVLPKPTPEKGIVTANAGPDQTILTGQLVTLDGSNSKDSQNKTLTFSWATTQKPAGSNSTLTNVTPAKPTFVPDVAGEYIVELTVSSTNGQKKDQVKITATAVPDNTTPTILNSDITTDLVLEDKFTEPGKADYLVTNTLQVLAKLTVKPGVVIEFDLDKGLEVLRQGSLVADGTQQQTITFTGKQKTPGFWKGIFIGGHSQMDYVEVAYGGSSNLKDMGKKTNVGVYGGHLEAAWLKVTNSTFKNANGYGMVVAGSITGFANNTFSQNSSLPMDVTASQIHNLDAASRYTIAGSTKGIGISGLIPDYVKDVIWPALPDGTKYLATGVLFIEGGVSVAPGVTIEFMAGKGLNVVNMGYLKAIGTATNKITFTGLSKVKGYWNGIMITSRNQLTELTHTEVSYAGKTGYTFNGREFKANVSLWGDAAKSGFEGSLRLTHSELTHSGGYGLVVMPGGGHLSEFAQNTFSQNTGAAIYIDPNNIWKLDPDSRLSGNNGYNGLETEGNFDYGPQNVEWPVFKDGSRYHVVDDLILSRGVIMENNTNRPTFFEFNDDKALYVQSPGFLNAKGKNEISQISFSALNAPSQHWKGILIKSTSILNELDYVSISYAGNNNLAGLNQKTNLAVTGFLKITNSRLWVSKGLGIYVKKDAGINEDAPRVNAFFGNFVADYYRE